MTLLYYDQQRYENDFHNTYEEYRTHNHQNQNKKYQIHLLDFSTSNLILAYVYQFLNDIENKVNTNAHKMVFTHSCVEETSDASNFFSYI